MIAKEERLWKRHGEHVFARAKFKQTNVARSSSVMVNCEEQELGVMRFANIVVPL